MSFQSFIHNHYWESLFLDRMSAGFFKFVDGQQNIEIHLKLRPIIKRKFDTEILLENGILAITVLTESLYTNDLANEQYNSYVHLILSCFKYFDQIGSKRAYFF